ncbi:MAG: hypothetical protein ACR2M6_01350, partial [Vampirovibrionia bacterium]
MGVGGLGDNIPITGERSTTDGSLDVNVTDSVDDSVEVNRTYTFTLPRGTTNNFFGVPIEVTAVEIHLTKQNDSDGFPLPHAGSADYNRLITFEGGVVGQTPGDPIKNRVNAGNSITFTLEEALN